MNTEADDLKRPRYRYIGRDDEGKAKFQQTEPGPWFPAKYPGKCVHCGEHFEPGESIRAIPEGGAYECSNCVQAAVNLLDTVRPTSICDKCFCPPPCNCS